MTKTSKRLIGPAAVSVLAAASLAGASAAAAGDEVCLECEPQFNAPGLNVAFFKLASNDFPGATSGVFECCILKDGQNALVKLAELGFPGNTEYDPFSK